MKTIKFDINMFPKFKRYAHYGSRSISNMLIDEGFKSTKYIWNDDLKHANEPTHSMNERDYSLFVLKWY